MTDELTGLYNQRHLEMTLSREIERSRRYDQHVAMIIVDVDGFKEINDTYGHMQGDLVLREVGRILHNSARELDECARYGGDELVVALPQTDVSGAFYFAERVRREIEQPRVTLPSGKGSLSTTVSIGVAAGSGEKLSREWLFAAADAALYAAKRGGRNRTMQAQPGASDPIDDESAKPLVS